MRFSTVIAGLLFGLEATAIRVGPVRAGQVAAEVCTHSCLLAVAQQAQRPKLDIACRPVRLVEKRGKLQSCIDT